GSAAAGSVDRRLSEGVGRQDGRPPDAHVRDGGQGGQGVRRVSQRTAAREEVSTDEADEAQSEPAPAAEPVKRRAAPKAARPAPAPADRSQLTAYILIWVAVLGAVA